jgi:flagellar biogenesis protein FliO
MLGEFLLRLAVALPLVCALAAVSLLAVKRGWLRLPGFPPARGARPAARHASSLEVLAVQSLAPTARLAVVRFAGRDHLVGCSGQSLALLATAPTPADAPAPAQASQPQEADPWKA